MKTLSMITVAALLGSVAWAAGRPGEQKVMVCLEESGGFSESPQVRMLASELFRSAGVRLEWRMDRRFCDAQGNRAIRIGLSMDTPQDLMPGALAYAFPFEGIHIRIFYDRIVAGTRDRPARAHMLAYVIVHEITHILEGLDRHSDSGIMKAKWTTNERDLISRWQLRFAQEDIRLIHDGLAAPAPRPASATLSAAAGL